VTSVIDDQATAAVQPSEWQKKIQGEWHGRPGLFDPEGNHVGYERIQRASEVLPDGSTVYWMNGTLDQLIIVPPQDRRTSPTSVAIARCRDPGHVHGIAVARRRPFSRRPDRSPRRSPSRTGRPGALGRPDAYLPGAPDIVMGFATFGWTKFRWLPFPELIEEFLARNGTGVLQHKCG